MSLRRRKDRRRRFEWFFDLAEVVVELVLWWR